MACQISGLSKAAEVLEGSTPTALEMAEGAAAFINKNLYNEITGELKRSYREGPGPSGQADDYAFLIQGTFFSIVVQVVSTLICVAGLLDLYEASGKAKYATWAVKLQEKQDELFYDKEAGGYFASAPDPHILVRMKDAQVCHRRS